MGWKVEDCADRRERTRFSVRAGVTFEWDDAKGAPHCGQGVTRDISSKGLFIFSDYLPPVKVDLRLEVLFGSEGEGTNLQLEVEALVLRVEPATALGTSSGFAVLNKSHNLADLRFLEPPDTYRRSEPN
jgi:PilZ domain